MHEDFFVVYRDHDGGANRGWLRSLALFGVLAAALLGAGLVAVQSSVATNARFEFGTTREYAGVLVGDPVPLLVADDRTYFLVNPLKFEFDPEARASLTGRRVQLRATLIERGDQAMLEVVQGTVEELGPAAAGVVPTLGESLGPVRLRGEIVDSKCYLGVMNPGHLKPHRACAINCLRGGIPPVLISRDPSGTTRQTVLVAADGVLLRDWILPWVAEPVELSGTLRRIGPLEILEISREGIRRLP
jgi:hypothetical protein